MDDPKYVIVDFGYVQVPLIGPHFVNHNEISNGRKVISAGFVSIKDDKISCYGTSFSLNVKSRGREDAELIESMLHFGENKS